MQTKLPLAGALLLTCLAPHAVNASALRIYTGSSYDVNDSNHKEVYNEGSEDQLLGFEWVSFSGALTNGWNVEVTGGTEGGRFLNFVFIAGTGSLTMEYSAAASDIGVKSFVAPFGGNFDNAPADWTLTYSTYYDETGLLFGTDNLLTTGAYGSTLASGSLLSQPVDITAEYSLTQRIVLTAPNSGVRYSISGDGGLAASVPDNGASAVLLGMAMTGMIGVAALRRKLLAA